MFFSMLESMKAMQDKLIMGEEKINELTQQLKKMQTELENSFRDNKEEKCQNPKKESRVLQFSQSSGKTDTANIGLKRTTSCPAISALARGKITSKK